jgi:glycosyltransferase 2 family protein
MVARKESGSFTLGISLRGALQLAIGVGALALVIFKADGRALLEAIKATRLAYLPLAVAASFVVTALMAYRWCLILRVRAPEAKTTRLFVYYLIGIFFMNFIPGGGATGDVARLVYATSEVRDRAFILSTLVYERLIGLFALLLIGSAATLASPLGSQQAHVVYVSEAVLAAAFMLALLLISDRISSWLATLITSIGARFGMARIGSAGARTLVAISELKRDRGLVARTLVLSILIRIVWALGCFVVARAMSLPIGLLTVISVISLVDLIRMMPVSINGLGVREWLIVVLLSSAGIGREQALTFAFLAFSPIVLNAVAGGLIYISRAHVFRSRAELNRSEV